MFDTPGLNPPLTADQIKNIDVLFLLGKFFNNIVVGN